MPNKQMKYLSRRVVGIKPVEGYEIDEFNIQERPPSHPILSKNSVQAIWKFEQSLDFYRRRSLNHLD
jgi:hypothetical protein